MTEVVAIGFPRQSLYVFWFFAIFERMYFIYFFRLLLKTFHRLPIFVYGLIFTIPPLIIYALTLRPVSGLETEMLISSVVIAYPCFLYYRKVMLYPIIVSPEKDTSFWMVTGVFFYFLIRFPVILFSRYFLNVQPILSSAVYSIQNFALVISYILFIKAMTCLKKRTC
jgi:hypothetical protein